MKLYEVPRNTRIKIMEESWGPPGVNLGYGSELMFHHVDGMYSYCTTDDNKETIHVPAYTEVTIVQH